MKIQKYLILLIVFLNSAVFALDSLPLVEVKHKYKNLSLEIFPKLGKENDFVEHLLRSTDSKSSDRPIAHEAAHIVQQRMQRIIDLTRKDDSKTATLEFVELVLELGKTSIPFDVSALLGEIHSQVMISELPELTFVAKKLSMKKHLYQHNQSDLDFLKLTLASCQPYNCSKEIPEEMKKQMELLLDQQDMLRKEMEEYYYDLVDVIKKNLRRFQTLSNASKAKHDAAMAAIQNTR